MSKQKYIKRYNLIINKLRKKPCSFVEIQDYLQLQSEIDSVDYELSIRTFQREIKEIEANYDIVIEYDKCESAYKITHDGNEIRNERLMETFDIIDALNISNSLSNHIILEKRRPLGTNNMNLFIHAIKNNIEVNFNHQKFWDDAKKKRITQPLALKESRNRWYLIALDKKDKTIKTFGLDRISELEITKKKFIPIENYNPDEAFQDSFGIIVGEKEVQKIVLSFTFEQGKYIKSLPLHHSQKAIIDNEKEFRIELFLRPTYDFVMELLSIGAAVKVIKPKKLQEEIKTILLKTLDLY